MSKAQGFAAILYILNPVSPVGKHESIKAFHIEHVHWTLKLNLSKQNEFLGCTSTSESVVEENVKLLIEWRAKYKSSGSFQQANSIVCPGGKKAKPTVEEVYLA